MTEQEDALAQAELRDPVRQVLALGSFTRAEKAHPVQLRRKPRHRFHERTVAFDGPEIADHCHGRLAVGHRQRRLQPQRRPGVEVLQIDSVPHHDAVLGPDALLANADLAHGLGVRHHQVGEAGAQHLRPAVPPPEARPQVAEVEPADDRLRARETRRREPEEVGVEIGPVHDPDALGADERRHPGDLHGCVRLQHRALEGEYLRLVSHRPHRLEHRAGDLQAAHHGAEALRVAAQALDELALGPSDPEAVDEVQHRDFSREHGPWHGVHRSSHARVP